MPTAPPKMCRPNSFAKATLAFSARKTPSAQLKQTALLLVMEQTFASPVQDKTLTAPRTLTASALEVVTFSAVVNASLEEVVEVEVELALLTLDARPCTPTARKITALTQGPLILTDA